jgi:hypothetical protein
MAKAKKDKKLKKLEGKKFRTYYCKMRSDENLIQVVVTSRSKAEARKLCYGNYEGAIVSIERVKGIAPIIVLATRDALKEQTIAST